MASTLMALTTVAQADLNRVGPSNVPSPPGHGFPFWYQDLNGMVLDLCLPNASDPGQLQQTACLLTPAPPLPTPPYVFPSNFPDEIFYHRVVSAPLATSAAKRAILVLALEAAFASGGPVAGQQIVFTRIRVTAGVPFDGDYTVTHPYGAEFFPNVVAGVGNRDIVFSEDVGIGAPGVFTGALTSRVGPFMQASATPGGPASPPVTLNGAQFLGDGVGLVNITGSPFGTNYFEICGPLDGPPPAPARCIRENLFSLTGRLHDFVAIPIGSPLTVNPATYARNAAGTQAQVDVSANAIPGIGQAAARLTAAAPTVSPVLMRGPTTPALGDFYAQGIPVPATEIPAVITVTNSGDVPPTSVTQPVVDQVSITQATWDPGLSILTVIATSSDKLATIVPPATVGATPALRIDGFPTATQVPGGIAGDPASVTFTVLNVLIPPPSLTVSSSRGGQGFSPVTMGLAAPFPCGVPFTQDDTATTVQSVPVVIPVLANDITGALCPLTGLPVVLAPGPSIGAASVNADGTISFTSGLTGTATFKYALADAVGTSNVATVTVTVNANPAGAVPTAVADGPFPVAAGATLAIPATTLTANDLANGGALDPASIQIVAGSVTGGTATVGAGGNVTYVAGATAGSFGFQYTVANTLATGGQRSAPATVSITVTANNDVLTVAAARFRTSIRRWDVSGTSTVSAGNVVTVTLFRGATAIGVVGTAPVVGGTWTLQVLGSNVIAQNGDFVVATSTANGRAQLPVQIRQ